MDNLKEEISNVNFNSDTTNINTENVENVPFFEKSSGEVGDCSEKTATSTNDFPQAVSKDLQNPCNGCLDENTFNGELLTNGEEDNKAVDNRQPSQNSDENSLNLPNNPNAAKTRYVERDKRSTSALILSLVGLLLSVVVFVGIIPSIMGFTKSLKLYKVEKSQTEKWGVWVGVVATLTNLFMIVAFILFLVL